MRESVGMGRKPSGKSSSDSQWAKRRENKRTGKAERRMGASRGRVTGWSLCETRNKAGRAVVGQTRVRARRTTGQPRRRFRDAWMTLIDVAYNSSGTAGGGSERVMQQKK